jgi:DNA-binding GntR family transcriptional regulator
MLSSESLFSSKLEELSRTLGRRDLLSNQIAEAIRSMIIAGQLSPGERIVESRVARQLGVGQPTVREALVALEHQGLVVRKANQGCVVTSLSRVEIGEILRIRADLEVLAVELAVENASDAEVRGLLERARDLKRTARAKDVEAFFASDFLFHQTLWKISGNSFLLRLLPQVIVPLLAFLFIRNVRSHAHIDMEASGQAHIDIAEAILTRDKGRARLIAGQKLQMFADQHLDLFEEAPSKLGNGPLESQ